MAAAIYLLCAMTCIASFGLLWRSWRRTRSRLVYWSALCFAGLSASNVLLVADKIVFPDVPLGPLRLWITLMSLLLLLFGLIWSDE